jgi:hypothetical protein
MTMSGVPYGQKIGRLKQAILLAAGLMQLRPDESGVDSRMVGEQLRYQLDNHYKTIAPSRPSRAAHYKRLAKKRKNIRARGKK